MATAEWTVLYHAPGKFKGRGEFLRLMLEDAGITDYVNTDKDLYGPSGIADMFRGDALAIKSPSPVWPVLFPPALHHKPKGDNSGDEEILINQVGACMIYLGDKLGYAPTTMAEKARANAVLMNCVDYIADGRVSFHPVKNTMSYNGKIRLPEKSSIARDCETVLFHWNLMTQTVFFSA
jgi:glutathione S-transferase